MFIIIKYSFHLSIYTYFFQRFPFMKIYFKLLTMVNGYIPDNYKPWEILITYTMCYLLSFDT